LDVNVLIDHKEPLNSDTLATKTKAATRNTPQRNDIPSSNHQAEGNNLIACDKNKGESTELLSIPEFWDKRNKCSHYFKNDTIFFHVGKAGGGTVGFSLDKYKIAISKNHPAPRSQSVQQLMEGPEPASLIINVRDPVDRFVSAFQWRMIVLCSPDDKRKRNSNGAAQRPHQLCKDSPAYNKEEKMLREKYKSSPSVLGEALCEESGKRTAAVEDASMIGHSLQLVQWLDFLVEPELIAEVTENGIRDFMALPLEKQEGNDSPLFEQHLDQLSLALLEQRYGREVATRIIESTPQTVRASEQKKEKWEHSSVQFNNSTKPPPLTKLGECCLSRHLEKDYRLIQSMLGDVDEEGVLIEPLGNAHPVIGNACKWGSDEQQKLCRADLRSILTRRAVYLDHSEGTCSEVVSRMQ
jgi:hypothetical protein